MNQCKPKIGLSTLFLLNQPFKTMCKHIANANVNYIEIVDEGLHALNKQRVSTLREFSKSHKFEYSVHAPFADINIASPSKPILKAMIKRLEKSLASASELNAYLWVFHPGLKTGVSMFYPRKEWYQNMTTMRTLLKIAEDYGVKIAVENVPEPYPFLMKNVEDFKKFFAEFNDYIDIVLDVGHANINGQTIQFLEEFPKKIVHMHVHDNNGHADQHLGIEHGTVAWKEFVAALREILYDKVVVVESVEHVQESIDNLKRLLF